MSIEVLPRAEVVETWTSYAASQSAGWPSFSEGDAAVRVPVVPRRTLPEGAFAGGVGLAIVSGNLAVQATHHLAWALIGFVPMGLAGGSRTLRLARLRGRRDADLLLGPAGLGVAGTMIPWSQVRAVVRLRVKDRTGQQFLAVEVGDFVELIGLSPFVAGLANLTRRRLVVLAEVSELADARGLATALEHLVAHPEDRALLATESGAGLVRPG